MSALVWDIICPLFKRDLLCRITHVKLSFKTTIQCRINGCTVYGHHKKYFYLIVILNHNIFSDLSQQFVHCISQLCLQCFHKIKTVFEHQMPF